MKKIKDLFKGKKQQPRPLDEIKKQYQQVATHAGGLQYEIEVKKAELNNVNQTMLNLNQEADARQKLDQAAAQALKEKQNEANPAN